MSSNHGSDSPSTKPRTRWRLYAGVFLTTFFLTLLLGGNTAPYNDGKQIFDHAEQLVYKGEIGITLAPGVKFYSPRPLLVSLIHVPDVALRRALGHFFPAADALTRLLTSHLVPAALLALLGLLFVRFLLRLSVSAGIASLGAVGLVFTTMLFVFGRVVWSDIVQAVAFWGFFSELLWAVDSPSRKRAIVVGIWGGLLLNTKYLYILSVAGGLLFAVSQTFSRLGPRRQATLLGWAVLAALPFALPIAWWNYVRNGTILHTGYAVEPFQESLFMGLYSLFFSTGKGLFVYNPTLVLGCHASPTLPRHWWWAVAAVAGPVVLLYGKYSNWSGDWSWGPRYMIFMVPILMVPATRLLERLWCERRRLALALVAGVAALGLCIQLMGAGMYWDHFIRLSQAARAQWLGTPNRAGAYTPPRGDHCDPCFEDLYAHSYLPAFQPIEGHYWLLKHAAKGDTWETAVADAPWRRYTSLPLDTTKRFYPWPSIDWWYLACKPKLANTGRLLFALLLLGSAGGVILWVQALRRCVRPPPASAPMAQTSDDQSPSAPAAPAAT